MIDNTTFHEADGSLTAITEFPFAEIDRNLGGESEINVSYNEPPDSYDLERIAKAIQSMIRWEWQSGKKNRDGKDIRQAIMAWVWLPEMHDYNETELAAALGKDKQSVGRWVEDFKRTFPMIRTPHLR